MLHAFRYLIKTVRLSILFAGFMVATFTDVTLINAQTNKEKIRIAITSFSSSDSYLSSQVLQNGVTDSLVNLGQYEVVAREQLDKVLTEQKLNNSQLIDPKTAQEVGKLLGAKYIVVGKVTDWSFKSANFGKDQFTTKAQIQLIEVESGSIKLSETFSATVSNSTTGASFMALIDDSYKKNQQLSNQERDKKYSECVKSISHQFADKINLLNPLEGYVVTVEGSKVALNLGQTSGIKPGQEFFIYKEGKQIKDPVTNEILSSEKKNVARLVIKQVEPKLSWAEIVATYSLSANIQIGSEKVDLYPVTGLISEKMTVIQTSSQAELINKKLDEVRKKSPKK